VGTLIVKPKRHVLHVAELTSDEASELGPIIQRTASVVAELLSPDQIYVCLWSHTGEEPVHIHWVVQPVTREQMRSYGKHGPDLQAEMFARREMPDPVAAAAFVERARGVWPS
jgi:diadenosine tetraphosphate (Ap4A) HIT family hydrolase